MGVLNPRRDHDLLKLGSETLGAVSLDMCVAAGVSGRRARELVASGRWQSPFPGVYVTFSGPIPPLTLLHAAVLYAGDGAALSHATAGWLWHLNGQPTEIHVIVPFQRAVAAQPGLIIHRSRTLDETDRHPALTPPRTRIERTVVDLLPTARTADVALGLVADAMRDRRTTPDRLRVALHSHPRTKWRGIVLEALPDVAAGAHSLMEIKDARMRRAHGLPSGKRQFKRDKDGVEYLDILIEEFRVHIELDGRLGHDRAREIWRDFRRDNKSEVLRLRHLRYGWADMAERECLVAAQQAEILRQQGWRGRFKRCKRCPRNREDLRTTRRA